MLLQTKSHVALAAGVLLLGGAAAAGWKYAATNSNSETTTDAYVTADMTLVAPKISELVEQVLVEDNQAVSVGQVLVRIDDRDFKAALQQAKADVASAQANIANKQALLAAQQSVIDSAQAAIAVDEANEQFAEQDNSRYAHLATTGYGSLQNAQKAASQIAGARAAKSRDQALLVNANKQTDVLKAELLQAQAMNDRDKAAQSQAELNLSYATIRAPINGFVGRRSVRPGSYINVGQALLAVVPTAEAYIVANFQEDQLRHMRLDQPVLVHVDGFGGDKLRGRINSLAPATDVAFAPIQPDNATGNFTKIVQRVPVKITIDSGQSRAGLLRVGMSVVPTVNTKAPGDAPIGIASNAP